MSLRCDTILYVTIRGDLALEALAALGKVAVFALLVGALPAATPSCG